MWTFLLGGLAIVFLGGVVWLWLAPKILSDEDLAELPVAYTAPVVRVVAKFPAPSENESLALVKQGLSIREPAKIAEYFRPGTASVQEVVDFLQGMESRDGPIAHYKWLSAIDANRLSIEGVLVEFESQDKPKSRLLLLTPDATGKWKIDFDAFARTVKPSWQDLMKKGSDVAQVRVLAAKDSYYNGPFADDKEWVCYGMVSPDTEQILLGYCKVGSAQAAAMGWIFSREAKAARVTLEIRRAAGAESRQFEISKVLAEDWVMGDADFDGNYNILKN